MCWPNYAVNRSGRQGVSVKAKSIAAVRLRLSLSGWTFPMTRTTLQVGCLCLVVGLGSCSSKDAAPKIVETRLHDILVLDNQFRVLPAVTVGIRTNPAANTLDDDDFELITADGKIIAPWKPAELLGHRPEAHEINGDWWILFAVPNVAADAGPMKVTVKSIQRTYDLSPFDDPKVE